MQNLPILLDKFGTQLKVHARIDKIKLISYFATQRAEIWTRNLNKLFVEKRKHFVISNCNAAEEIREWKQISPEYEMTKYQAWNFLVHARLGNYTYLIGRCYFYPRSVGGMRKCWIIEITTRRINKISMRLIKSNK